MSPILVRPVREQIEHDRLIRLLQAKARRRYEASINPGAEQNAGVGSGPTAMFPDLVLSSLERGHRLQAVVEVETGESVNHLEALAEWAHFGKLRAAFHLYVPAGMVDVARQLCDDNQVHVNEIWSYHAIGDQVRFTLVHRNREIWSAPAVRKPARAGAVAAASVKKPAASVKKPAARKPKAASRPAKRVKSAKKPVRAKKRK